MLVTDAVRGQNSPYDALIQTRASEYEAVIVADPAAARRWQNKNKMHVAMLEGFALPRYFGFICVQVGPLRCRVRSRL